MIGCWVKVTLMQSKYDTPDVIEGCIPNKMLIRFDSFCHTTAKSHCKVETKWIREALLRQVHSVEGHDQFRLDVHMSCAKERVEKGHCGGMYPLW